MIYKIVMYVPVMAAVLASPGTPQSQDLGSSAPPCLLANIDDGAPHHRDPNPDQPYNGLSLPQRRQPEPTSADAAPQREP